MREGWEITHRIYSDREEAWIKWKGQNIMVLFGDLHGDVMEKAQRYTEREDRLSEGIEPNGETGNGN